MSERLSGPDFLVIDDQGFDINAAFQEALFGVASDEELAFDEKVQRMEQIIAEGTGDIYKDFVSFRDMAAHLEMICSHDHALGEAVQNNSLISGFMNEYQEPAQQSPPKREKEVIGNKKKKKSKKKSWFDYLLRNV